MRLTARWIRISKHSKNAELNVPFVLPLRNHPSRLRKIFKISFDALSTKAIQEELLEAELEDDVSMKY